jgi:hypothetical protein
MAKAERIQASQEPLGGANGGRVVALQHWRDEPEDGCSLAFGELPPPPGTIPPGFFVGDEEVLLVPRAGRSSKFLGRNLCVPQPTVRMLNFLHP